METATTFIDLTSDFGFKKLFGEEPNKDLLLSFLNEVFQGRKRIQDLEYTPNEALGNGLDEGQAIFDLVCTGSEGEKFIIEVQCAKQTHFKKRALFYTSRLISNQAPKGRRALWDYAITEVYLVALLDGFTITDVAEKSPVHDICLCNRQTGKIFYEGFGFIYIELAKFLKEENQLESDLDRWLFILKNMSRLKKISVYLQKPIFQKVFDIATYNNLNKEERMTYDISLKRKWDQYSIKQTAFHEGKDEGKREGILEGKREGKREGLVVGIKKGAFNKAREIALKLHNKGLSMDLITESTGLSEAEINELLKK